MDTKQFLAKVKVAEPDGDIGRISALFSVFNEKDRDGDVVLPSFFTDGQEILMAAWGHNWGSLNPGKGVVRITEEGAVFEGMFNLKTQIGRDHYETVKFNENLQQYSFGFSVLESERGQLDDEPVKFLKRGEIHEASPVLVGANSNTRTLAIKGMGLSLSDHSSQVLAACDELSERLRSHAELRTQKEGRTLSTANRDRLKAHREALRGIADDLDALLAATAPDDGKGADLLALLIETELIEARLNGVAA